MRVLPQRHALGLDTLAADGGPDQLHVVAEAACENLCAMAPPQRMSPVAPHRPAALGQQNTGGRAGHGNGSLGRAAGGAGLFGGGGGGAWVQWVSRGQYAGRKGPRMLPFMNTTYLRPQRTHLLLHARITCRAVRMNYNTRGMLTSVTDGSKRLLESRGCFLRRFQVFAAFSSIPSSLACLNRIVYVLKCGGTDVDVLA